jgi:thiol:disulfide interchange protein
MAKSLLAAAASAALLLASGAGSAQGLGYDPDADPFAELAEGAARAKADDKLVLLIAGGEWCIWCHYLDAFVKDNADVAEALYDTFVVVKVYMGEDNENEEFFAGLPTAAGYPHFWVFTGDSHLLSSEQTVVLEDGAKSYDKDKFLAFVDRWKNRG